MYTSEELKKRIKERADEKNIGLKQLALNVGLSINALYNIKGEQGITCFNLAKLADELDCSTDYLLGRSDV